MAQKLTEGIVDKLLTYYKANMAAKVSALNTEYNDDFDLTAPTAANYYVGEKRLMDGPDFPSLFIWGDRMHVLRYNSTYTDALHELSVMVAVKAMESDRLQRLMYRYGRAIWELTVSRFFSSTPDDYFSLHSDGDISLEYERPPAQDVAPLYIGKVTLTFTANKQEDV